MSLPFFITGLPRSRTAWLSVFLTGEQSHCEHDLLGRVESWDVWNTTMRAQTGKIRGDADSALMPLAKKVLADFPDSPWVFVRRDFDAAWLSFVRAVESSAWRGTVDTSKSAMERLHSDYCRSYPHVLANSKCMVVEWENCGRPETLESIWGHCLPSLPYNHERTLFLSRMRVTVVPELHPLRIDQNIIALWQSGQP